MINGLAKDYKIIKSQFGEEFVKFLEIDDILRRVHNGKFSIKEQMRDVLAGAKKIENIDQNGYLDPTIPLILGSINLRPPSKLIRIIEPLILCNSLNLI